MVYQRKKRAHNQHEQLPVNTSQNNRFASPDLETDEADSSPYEAQSTTGPSLEDYQRIVSQPPAYDFGSIPLFAPDQSGQREPLSPLMQAKMAGPLNRHLLHLDGAPPPFTLEPKATQSAIQRDEAVGMPKGNIGGPAAVSLTPKGSGSPLPKQVEDNFVQSGYPEVKSARVHVDDAATQSIQAKAYTQKNNIVVQSSGANDPKLLGHEATHVVQQSQMALKPDVNGTPINANPALEKNADDNGERVVRNESVSVKGASTQQILSEQSTPVQAMPNVVQQQTSQLSVKPSDIIQRAPTVRTSKNDPKTKQNKSQVLDALSSPQRQGALDRNALSNWLDTWWPTQSSKDQVWTVSDIYREAVTQGGVPRANAAPPAMVGGAPGGAVVGPPPGPIAAPHPVHPPGYVAPPAPPANLPALPAPHPVHPPGYVAPPAPPANLPALPAPHPVHPPIPALPNMQIEQNTAAPPNLNANVPANNDPYAQTNLIRSLRAMAPQNMGNLQQEEFEDQIAGIAENLIERQGHKPLSDLVAEAQRRLQAIQDIEEENHRDAQALEPQGGLYMFQDQPGYFSDDNDGQLNAHDADVLYWDAVNNSVGKDNNVGSSRLFEPFDDQLEEALPTKPIPKPISQSNKKPVISTTGSEKKKKKAQPKKKKKKAQKWKRSKTTKMTKMYSQRLLKQESKKNTEYQEVVEKFGDFHAWAKTSLSSKNLKFEDLNEKDMLLEAKAYLLNNRNDPAKILERAAQAAKQKREKQQVEAISPVVIVRQVTSMFQNDNIQGAVNEMASMLSIMSASQRSVFMRMLPEKYHDFALVAGFGPPGDKGLEYGKGVQVNQGVPVDVVTNKERPMYRWLYENGPEPDSMNCWEAVLFAGYRIGRIDKSQIETLISKTGAGKLEMLDRLHQNSRGTVGGLEAKDFVKNFRANPPHIPLGDIIDWGDGTHVAVSCGNGMVIEHDAATGTGEGGVRYSTLEAITENVAPKMGVAMRMIWGPFSSIE